MNDLIFENQGTNTYLVYTIAQEDIVDSMSLGMLTNNKIFGLAPTSFMQMDETKYIKYNVSAKISVKQFFTGAVNKKRLLGVFDGIINAFMSAEDYMIDTNSILLNLDYIFTDVSTCETILVCLPVESVNNEKHDLGGFIKNIMFSTQFDQTENCDHIAKLINYLNSVPVFSLTEFKGLLDSLKEPLKTIAGAQQLTVQQPIVQTSGNQQSDTGKVSAQQSVVQAQAASQPVQQRIVPQQPMNNIPIQINAKTQVQQPNQSSAVQKPIQTPPVTQQVQQPEAGVEKQISMFYLLQHYNKENAELYKTQKAAKKSGQSKTVAKQPKNSATFTVPGTPVNNNFAVPGQPASTPVPTGNFAIPGQPTPPPVPKNGFAVPGQAPAQPTQKTSNQQTVIPKTPEPMVQQAQPMGQQAQSVVQPIQPFGNAYAQPQGQSMNFGETTVLGLANAGETTVLSANPGIAERKPHLLRKKNNEEVLVDKPVFRIGKERSYVDYFIGDNTAISRSHANIITRGEEYFVVDTNSTNHTYVNGVMLQSNAELKISHGDKIRFANEEFEFKLY